MKRTRLFSLAMAIYAIPSGRLFADVTAHYINVGQAASALVEFDSGAILVDAGGESTGDTVYRDHLVQYLKDFFQARPQLNNTLEAVIISHPHIDHTMNLMDVMQNFSVHALIDNGADRGSGISPLKKARQFAKQQKLHYVAVGDASIHGGGMKLSVIESGNTSAPEILLLSGARGCDNANNDSIAVHIETAETALLFTGDAENEDKTCTPELSALADKYNKTLLLNAEVYHVAHHGSFNGTTPEFMKLVTPRIAVISAGDPLRKGPGQFHAPQFGHPPEIAVTMVTDSVTGTRSDFGETHKSVTIFSKVQTPKTISMDKALYCTCWDGDVKVQYKQGETTPTITMTNFRPNVH